jgi:hypothetical protein
MDSSSDRLIASIRATVESMEARLGRGDLPDDGLADLKSAVDDARLRLWALLTAKGASAPGDVLLGFRLRRAAEICRDVTADLDAGTLGVRQRELLALREAAAHLVDRISTAVRDG